MAYRVKGVALFHNDGCQLVKVTRFVSLNGISNALFNEICFADFHLWTRSNATIHSLGTANGFDGVRNNANANSKRAPVRLIYDLML